MLAHALHQINAFSLPTWAAWLLAYLLFTSFVLAFNRGASLASAHPKD